jgi:hypothetical protein
MSAIAINEKARCFSAVQMVVVGPERHVLQRNDFVAIGG